jgi:hypothetical protein
MKLLDRLIMPWRLPACCTLTLPVAVILKRFFTLDLVFILGILRFLLVGFPLFPGEEALRKSKSSAADQG